MNLVPNVNWHFYNLQQLDITPFRFKVDDHSVVIGSHWAPLIQAEIEIYFRKNYWVKRGIYPWLTILGLDIEYKAGEGEKTYSDELVEQTIE